MADKKIPQVIFSPGCFDNFEGTQEELDQLIAEIHKLAESGALLDESVSLDQFDLESLPEHLQQEIFDELSDQQPSRPPRTLQ